MERSFFFLVYTPLNLVKGPSSDQRQDAGMHAWAWERGFFRDKKHQLDEGIEISESHTQAGINENQTKEPKQADRTSDKKES
jgi:hypothetical protein